LRELAGPSRIIVARRKPWLHRPDQRPCNGAVTSVGFRRTRGSLLVEKAVRSPATGSYTGQNDGDNEMKRLIDWTQLLGDES
jgi:hypothetical protein